jgi:hypothetical protein
MNPGSADSDNRRRLEQNSVHVSFRQFSVVTPTDSSIFLIRLNLFRSSEFGFSR